MEKEIKRIKIKLTESLLGTVPKNKQVYKTHIVTRAKEIAKRMEEDEEEYVENLAAEEVETVEDVEEKGWTGFHKDDDGIFILNYMLKGFAKAATEVAMEMGWIKPKITAYKKWIDLLLFVEPRRLRWTDGNGTIITEPDDCLERPLRTMSAKGPRVTVTRSDLIEAGRCLEFDLIMMPNGKGVEWDNMRHSFDYGRLVGLGQWRASGGFGKFEVLSVV